MQWRMAHASSPGSPPRPLPRSLRQRRTPTPQAHVGRPYPRISRPRPCAAHTHATQVVSRQPSPDNPEAFLRGGRVDTAAILAAVRRQLGIGLDASHVLADAPIDTFGSYKVPLNLRTLEGQQVELTVHVDRRAVREATSAAAAAGARQAAA